MSKEKKANEAWDTFRYHMRSEDIQALPEVSFNWPPSRELVTYAWRMMAARLHPDVGGAADAFVAAKDAKDTLLDYLQSVSPAKPTPRGRGGVCGHCDGRGTVVLASGRLGAAGLRKRCHDCGGTGRSCY